MTDEQINVAIGEVCGWIPSLNQNYGDIIRPGKTEHNPRWRTMPDYCHDLNAMHEAEVWLENEIATADQYWTRLAEMTMADDEELCTCTRYRYIGNATARQRALAFIKTLGLERNNEEQKS